MADETAPDVGLGDYFSRMNFGTGSPAEMAQTPSGLVTAAHGLYNSFLDLSKRAIGSADQYSKTGTYDNPGPILEASTLALGGPAVGVEKAAGEAVLGSGPIIRTANPIKAYHSSPHDFDAFRDAGRIGEGNRMIAEGGYFATNPEVSGQGGQYWQKFLRKFGGDEGNAAGRLSEHGFDRGAAVLSSQKNIDELRAALLDAPAATGRTFSGEEIRHLQQMLEARQRQHTLLESGNPVGPRTYEVNIHANPDDMLHWDKPVEGQKAWENLHPEVKAAIDDALDVRGLNAMSDAPEAYTGRELYKSLKHEDVHEVLPAELPGSSWFTGETNEARHTAAYLESLGVPAVKYLDQGSRGEMGHLVTNYGPGEWIFKGRRYNDPALLALDVNAAKADFEARRSYNYVVLPGQLPSRVEIMKKYALPGGAGGALGAEVLAQQPEQGM